MTEICLEYRCCSRLMPDHLKHSEVEVLAQNVRHQLVGSEADAVPLSLLAGIHTLKINGVRFDLWVDTEHPVKDEQGLPVLGVCEFDAAASMDAALLSISPVSSGISNELVLSTFAHELGHAIFEAPGWVVAATKGPGLFDEPESHACKSYRTTTQGAEHLALGASTTNLSVSQRITDRVVQDAIKFAEFRANEFMGSLLVPRSRLVCAAEELAGQFSIVLRHAPSLMDDVPVGTPQLSLVLPGDRDKLDRMLKTAATRFGVNPRFIEVRLQRYGLLASTKTKH